MEKQSLKQQISMGIRIKKVIGKFLFERVHGWRFVGKPMPVEASRCVFVFAPHTSNWDFYFGLLCMMSLGVPIKVAIKDFWTQFPFGLVVKPLGGVGITRSKKRAHKNHISIMAAFFDKYEHIAFIITPEGTRSRRTKWKTGFYYVAKKANVPIVTFRADFSKRTCDFGPVFSPETDIDAVMKPMMKFFAGGVAYHPELFAVDERYV